MLTKSVVLLSPQVEEVVATAVVTEVGTMVKTVEMERTVVVVRTVVVELKTVGEVPPVMTEIVASARTDTLVTVRTDLVDSAAEGPVEAKVVVEVKVPDSKTPTLPLNASERAASRESAE